MIIFLYISHEKRIRLLQNFVAVEEFRNNKIG